MISATLNGLFHLWTGWRQQKARNEAFCSWDSQSEACRRLGSSHQEQSGEPLRHLPWPPIIFWYMPSSQLVPVPRTPTVLEILEDFSLHARSMGKNSKYALLLIYLFHLHYWRAVSSLREPDLLTPTIISGLQVYFDKSLGANLLYRFERPQYAEIRRTFITGPKVIVGQEKEMSAIYGAEHLLRMLGTHPEYYFSSRIHQWLTVTFSVSLPQMVATSTMDPESVTLVRDYVNELLSWVSVPLWNQSLSNNCGRWMVQERERLFVKEYESASLQYQNISKA